MCNSSGKTKRNYLLASLRGATNGSDAAISFLPKGLFGARSPRHARGVARNDGGDGLVCEISRLAFSRMLDSKDEAP